MTLSKNNIDQMTEYGIPGYMQGGLVRYFNDHQEPGSFLMAVLSNDLMSAVCRADGTNKYCLHAYCNWLYNEPPGRPNGWGSPEAVRKWLSHDPGAGIPE